MNIAVFLGSKSGNDPIFTEKIKELGAWIGKNGHTLVYGGSDVGLMHEVSQSAKENGGKLVGVGVDIEKITKVIRSDLDFAYNAKDLQERKKIMLTLSDVFIAFPGSIGTLDELTDIAAGLKLNLYAKPLLIYNINGFYNPLMDMFKTMVDYEFLSNKNIKLIKFVENLDDIKNIIQ